MHISYDIITCTSDDFSKLSEGNKSCSGNLGSLHSKEKTDSFRYTECCMAVVRRSKKILNIDRRRMLCDDATPLCLGGHRLDKF